MIEVSDIAIDINIEGFGRWAAYSRINNLSGQIDKLVHREIYKQLEKEHSHADLHKLTCAIERFRANSVTLDGYLTRKVIKYRIKGQLTIDVELVDDFEINEFTWKALKEKRNAWLMDGNIPFDLVLSNRK